MKTTSERLTDVYRSLVEVGQALLWLQQPEQMYQAVCRSLVARAHAVMAWIGEPRDGFIVPIAWGGPAQAYTQGLGPGIEIRRPADGTAANCGPTARACLSGRPQVCNDFLNDASTAPWRERAAHFGVRSSAAFPIMRGEVVTAVLNLYFDQVDAFDAEMVELMRRLVGDLALALDQLDRQAEYRRIARDLREREQLLSGIVETSMDAMITVDANQHVVQFNRAAEQMFGIAAADAIGSSLDRFIPPSLRAAHRGHLARFAAEGHTARAMGERRALEAMRADGEVFPVEASISRVGEGASLLMTATIRDITERRRSERAVLAQTAAEAANRAKTEFLSRISHELRTPLNAVLGFAQLMQSDRGERLSERQRHRLSLMLQGGEQLRRLLDDILDISSIEAGRMTVQAETVELCDLLDGVIRMSELHAIQNEVSLQQAFSELAPVPLSIDAARLRQVLLNLMSNAIKYNRVGGWVRLELEVEPATVHITVRDNGIGMSNSQRAELFEPFNRLGREHSGIEGSGIGLVLVRQLVGLLGGSLELQSTPGAGTAVRLTLPRGTGLAPGHDAAAPPADAAARPAEAPSGRVLYIEDNPINAMLVEQVLARWPTVTLVHAKDGRSGLRLARALQPDLILLDMQLPDLDGPTLFRQMKADAALAAVPVVVLSATATPDDVAAMRAAGVADYWTKPIEFGPFLDGVRRLLNGRER